MTYEVQYIGRGFGCRFSWWHTVAKFPTVEEAVKFTHVNTIQKPYRVVDDLGEEHLFVGERPTYSGGWIESYL